MPPFPRLTEWNSACPREELRDAAQMGGGVPQEPAQGLAQRCSGMREGGEMERSHGVT